MAPSYRGRPGVRVAAPSGGLVKAINNKRASEAAAAAAATAAKTRKTKRPEREPVAVDAPPLSTSDEEEDDSISDSSAPEKEKGPKDKRRPGLLIAAIRHKSSGGDSSDGSLRGTKRRRPKGEDKDGEEVEGVEDVSEAAAAIQKITNTHGTPVFKKYEDSSSDLSEPDERAENPKQTANNTKSAAKGGKARNRVAPSPGLPQSPPPTARFIKPPDLTPERELSAEEAEKRKATSPKKFKHSKRANSDDEKEQAEEEKKKEAKPKKFQHSKWENSDDEGDRARRISKEKPEPKTTTTTSKSRLGSKAAKQSSKEEHGDPETDVKAVLKARQPWRQNLEKKNAGIQSGIDKHGKNGKSPLSGQLEVDKEAPPPPPRAVFKMPTFDSFHGNADSQDQDSQDVDDVHDVRDESDDAGNASDDTLAYKGPATCPLCKAPLDEGVLRGLLAGHHLLVGVAVGRSHVVQLNLLKFDEKLRFCAGHKQHDGRAAWTARGYPAIDWTALPARLPKYEAHVKEVILGTTPSPFRVAWEAASFSAASLSAPGYYGRRGLRVLSEAIVQRHASTLSRRAIEDPLVAARGMVQFVQAVLVPELAVQLIREDLQAVGGGKGKRNSSLDEARRVLHESAALGEDLMDEERDVVEDEEEEDDDDEEKQEERGEDSEDSDAMSM
ncbi:hypothetical protein SCUCBS95973_005863 [Sporothrix curviconia]|uniref:Restriction of telomere capping protein 4 n=1 Tax=Sporothrix curviconia TaxID=1260050 RepID=A0ABP0C2A2_9PEZI